MEESNRLYSGLLSKAAQKILAVLRTQSPHAARHNRSFSNNHRQIESHDGSQREPWTQSSWRISQEDSTERNTDHSTEEIRPSFILNLSPGDEGPDEVLFPTIEHSNTHKEEPALACEPVSSCLGISVETDSDTSFAQKEMKSTESWNIPRNEQEKTVALGSQSKWKQPISNISEDATSGGKDEGILYQQSESGTIETGRVHLPLSVNVTRRGPMRWLDGEEGVEQMVHSETITGECAGPILNIKHEMQDGVNKVAWKEIENRDAILPDDKESATETGTNDTEGAKPGQKEENDFEYRGSKNKEVTVGYHTDRPVKISISVEMRNHKMSCYQVENTEILGHTVVEIEEKLDTKASLLHFESAKLVLGDSTVTADNLKRTTEESIDGMETGLEVKEETEQHRQCETGYREVCELFGKYTEPGESGKNTDESVMTAVNSEDEGTSTEDSGRESRPTPTLSQRCGVGGSGFRAPCLRGNHQHHDNVQATNGSTGGSNSSIALATANSFTSGQISSVQNLAITAIRPRGRLEKSNQNHSVLHQPVLSFSLKRKHEVLQPQNVNPLPKISLTRPPPELELPHSLQERTVERGVIKRKRIGPEASILEHPALALEPQTQAGPSHKTEVVLEMHTDPYVPTKAQQSKVEERGHEVTRNASRQTPSSVAYKPPKHKRAKCGPQQATSEPKTSHEGANASGPQNRSKAGCLTAALTSDPRVKDSGKLSPDEKMQILEKAEQVEALVLTMVYRDGTTQLDPEQVLSRSQLVVCYKAKALLRTALQFYRQDLNWKQGIFAGCHIQDPQVSGWLLDPADPSSCYQELLNKHLRKPWITPTLGTKKVSQIISGLYSLYCLNMDLCCKLQSQGLWELYSDMELNMIPVLAAMENHRIHVDKEALKRTSDLLGVLFEKLRLHERCENKKLPKTMNKQQQSTSEAASYISSTWYQTSAVTGRISAKHPNFQALPRQPLQITKKQYIQGKDEEVVTVHPRAMFIPQEGWTFLAAVTDYKAAAPLLKGVSEGEVTSEDREHAKRIVYSVVYGAGRERLSGILGVSAEQASRFQDSFLQTYREVQAFIQRTIQQCHKQGYVLSIMGRRRTLRNIHSPDWGVRMQAERQAVNFVVQGSAADLCKMAMIRIFHLVSSSSSISARLIAQLHDELLYEVEDSQTEQFAALVKSTMESLQHTDHLGFHLKVPLKVAVYCGKSWGSMSELNIPPTSPSPSV
ncbi:hypothetical protein PAMP_015814 [Pampus punctatissimus]